MKHALAAHANDVNVILHFRIAGYGVWRISAAGNTLEMQVANIGIPSPDKSSARQKQQLLSMSLPGQARPEGNCYGTLIVWMGVLCKWPHECALTQQAKAT